MRRRVLLLVFSTTLFALTVLGVVLMVAIWQATTAATQDRVQGAAAALATEVEDRVGQGVKPTLTLIEPFAISNNAYVRVEVPESGVWGDAFTLTAGEPVDGEAFVGAAYDGKVEVAVSISKASKVQQLVGQGLIVLAIAFFALAVTMVFAWYYTKRLTRPFVEFQEFIGSVATGDRRGLKKRYGLPEIDMVAEVLDTGISRFDDMLERERQATQDASHQLKSPLTAISMRLEEITMTDDLDVAHEEATVALAQVERLAAVVDDVVGVMRGQRSSMPTRFAIEAMVRDQVQEWMPSYRAAGRELVVSGRDGLHVEAERGAQAQVLATLLENSLAHGAGVTTVNIRLSSGWAVVEVGDQGPGVPPELEGRVFDRSVSGGGSSGLGLSVARTLVSGDGGRLELISPRPAVFAIFLPALPEPESVSEPSPVLGQQAPRAQDQAEVETAASSAASVSSGNTQRR